MHNARGKITLLIYTYKLLISQPKCWKSHHRGLYILNFFCTPLRPSSLLHTDTYFSGIATYLKLIENSALITSHSTGRRERGRGGVQRRGDHRIICTQFFFISIVRFTCDVCFSWCIQVLLLLHVLYNCNILCNAYKFLCIQYYTIWTNILQCASLYKKTSVKDSISPRYQRLKLLYSR